LEVLHPKKKNRQRLSEFIFSKKKKRGGVRTLSALAAARSLTPHFLSALVGGDINIGAGLVLASRRD
jgi:hypothetical protein